MLRWVDMCLVFYFVRKLMILPYTLFTLSDTKLYTFTTSCGLVLSFSLEPWHSVWSDVDWKRVRKVDMHTPRQKYTHLPLFTRMSQSNRLLVSGSVWWDLVLGPWSINYELSTGPWNPSADETVTLNLSDHKALLSKRQNKWSPNSTSEVILTSEQSWYLIVCI